jgi:membrane protein implicated in regulation of membrane protease activity
VCVFSRPDPQSFTKFALSAGVFLLIAAFVVPAFVLRETGALRISEHELSTLTPLARNELERRQRIARSAGIAAPYVGVVFFILGGALLVYGAPRLKRKEDADEERFSVELAKLRSEIEPQSKREREERLKEEVEEELSDKQPEAVGSAEEEQRPSPAQPPEPTTNVRDLMLRAATVERDVLDHLAQIAPPNYELQANVKVSGGLLLDGLLVSGVAHLPDLVVEIKLMGRFLRSNLTKRLNDSVGRLLRYRARVKRAATGWVIIVVDGAISAADRDLAMRRASEYAADLRVSLITMDELPDLVLPTVA